jgi:SHAQKYF class myb-like DNA-binding protein
MSNFLKSDSQSNKSSISLILAKNTKYFSQPFFTLHRPILKDPEKHLKRNEVSILNEPYQDTVTSLFAFPITNNLEKEKNYQEQEKDETGPILSSSVTLDKNNMKGIEGQQRKKIKMKKLRNPVRKEENFNTGRWTQEEHRRFVEAIMRYGNEWKNVQQFVKTRSSTQARSHAQKFFYKMKKNNLLDFDIDLNKNSIKSLHEFANTLDENQYSNIINTLNLMAYEKLSPKAKTTKMKFSEDNLNFNDLRKYLSLINSNISFDDENISSYKEIKDNMSELTSSSSMNKKKPVLTISAKDNHIDFLDYNNPLIPEDNHIFNLNQAQKKTLYYFSNLNTVKKEIKHFPNNQIDDIIENDSDCYFKEAKRKLSFQSSFNFSFNNNNKLNFSDDETENLKLFSADNSNTVPLKKSVSEKITKNEEKKTKANIFKSFSIVQKSEINKSILNNNFTSSTNNINKLKNKKLFVINNIQIKKKPCTKVKTYDKKKMKFITHSVSNYLIQFPNSTKKYKEEQDITKIFLE